MTDTEQPWLIPRHWEWKRLCELGEVVGGGTPSTKVPEYWSGNVAWISPADLSGYEAKTIASGRKSITETGLRSSGARLMPPGSVLFSSRAPIGYVAVAGALVSTNQGFKSLVPSERVLPDYLYWFLKGNKRLADERASGTTFREISGKQFGQIPVPVPPVHEQERIVARIEELMSDVEAGVADTRVAERLIGRCRQAARNHLTLGGVSRGLDAEGKPVLPDGWEWSCVGEIAELVQYGTGDKAATSPTPFPVLRMGNVRDGRILPDDLKYMPPSWGDAEKYRLQPGDILFNRTNSPELVGKAAVYAGVPEDAVFASYLIRVRLNPSRAIPEFVIHCVNSAFGRGYVASVVSQQVGQANVNGTKLKHFPIPLPPLDEQERLAGQADDLLLALDAIQEDVVRSLRQAESLRQSILKSAFSGQLT